MLCKVIRLCHYFTKATHFLPDCQADDTHSPLLSGYVRLMANGDYLELMGITLRIPDSYDAKIAKICNLWTFWSVIPINPQ